MKGKLIEIGGTDGSGKETQTKELVNRLRSLGHTVQTLDFPQYENNFFGKLLKKSLRGEHGDFIDLDPHLACPLYAADRFESKPQIEKWLADGNIIILDRYVASNQIHQGGKIKDETERKEFMEWLDKLEHGVFGLPRPDQVIYLGLPVEIVEKLIQGRAKKTGVKKDLAEKNIDHLHDSRACALWLAEQNNNWTKIDCEDGGEYILSIEEIHEKVYSVVNEIIN